MVDDPAIFIKFKLKDQNKYVVAWTTTPWTLPGNLALAVNRDETYVEVEMNSDHLVFAKARLESVCDSNEYKVVEEFKGEKLIGLEYEFI